ncbi:glycosyltransferase family 1 protein [Metabacillus sediminilitoris]|uniref:Glycosyltransferase family 1 protein n=1 Tax=Metabacillus sediminilitoris TaxID=2567941 RepID=A0A4S4C4G7_9BACI|nr:glycosyltransferase family 1 protein [Metabacillus sediminilitoris]QGQ47228.1 glycosyltransferase [Metabacillus sediminilitoris]THF80571.1 glycosyltransferase family 1 protein [Metabacillus sediminilitoris]
MQPIRVLQVVTIMNRGGLETMLMNYYRQIDRTKIQFDFMVHRDERGHYDDEIESLGGKIYRMPPIRPGNYHKYFNLLNEFFSEHKMFKVVHGHNNENSCFVLRAAKRFGVPCRIAHSHLSDLGIDIKLPFRLYARHVMKDNPTQYFACSKNAGKWLFGEQQEVTVLSNAVNVNDFKFSEQIRSKIRKELNIDNKLVIGHIGRFNKQKNHELLIDIFKAVHEKKSDAILLLIGDGHLRSEIEKKVEKLGLSSNVKFLGVREDIAQLMQAMDLFLFPSLFEGLPVVLVEAQAAGLNCIVSDSITSETDITGRIQYINLKDSIDLWVDRVITTTTEHADTSQMLRSNGFDTTTMANWLTDFYLENSLEKVGV